MTGTAEEIDLRLSAIPAGDAIVLDTSALIAYLGGAEPVSATATELLDGMILTGRNPGVVSSISVAELMVRPLADGPSAAAAVTAFLMGFSGITIRSADFLVAAEAARIRVLTRAATPDALIAATATLTESRWLVTNDRVLRDRLRPLAWATTVLLLDDVAASGPREPAPGPYP